jgi:hypothetical protein
MGAGMRNFRNWSLKRRRSTKKKKTEEEEEEEEGPKIPT